MEKYRKEVIKEYLNELKNTYDMDTLFMEYYRFLGLLHGLLISQTMSANENDKLFNLAMSIKNKKFKEFL